MIHLNYFCSFHVAFQVYEFVENNEGNRPTEGLCRDLKVSQYICFLQCILWLLYEKSPGSHFGITYRTSSALASLVSCLHRKEDILLFLEVCFLDFYFNLS